MQANIVSNALNFAGPALLLVNAAAVLAAALTDVFYRKIPNAHVILVALCALLYSLVFSRDHFLLHVLNFIYVSAVGIILFRKKILGGGDVKFIAALALWFLPQQLGAFIITVLICGGVLGAAYLSACLLHLVCKKYLPSVRVPEVRSDAGMPYGVPTAVGFAIVSMRFM